MTGKNPGKRGVFEFLLMIAAFYFNDSFHGDTQNRATLFLSLATKTTLALLFPLLMFAFRFFDERELRKIAKIWQKVTVTLKRRRLNESWLIVAASVGLILLLGCLMLWVSIRRG